MNLGPAGLWLCGQGKSHHLSEPPLLPLQSGASTKAVRIKRANTCSVHSITDREHAGSGGKSERWCPGTTLTDASWYSGEAEFGAVLDCVEN